MRRFLREIQALLIFVTSAASAGPAARASNKVVYDRKTHIDFEEKSVDGEFLRPDGQAVQGDKNTDFDSLMRARSNFKKELKRSSGAIR